MRSPDAAFVQAENWNELTNEQKKKFPPVCPAFVIELKSDSDTVVSLRKKIVEDWLPNGCRLAWLIDADEQKAYIFCPDAPEMLHEDFAQPLTDDDLLPHFALDLTALVE